MTHAWCRDPTRDERVRAAEDGRQGALPTLGEAIGEVFSLEADFPATEKAASEETSQSGLRTERVTLEITHGGVCLPIELFARNCVESTLRALHGPGESVRVVSDEEREKFTSSCPIAGGTVVVNGEDMVTLSEFLRHTTKLTQEAGVAKRERDELRKSWLRSEESGTRLLAERNAALDAADVLRKRVAELEAASGGNQTNQPLAEGGRPCDSTHGIGNRTGCQCPSTGGIESRGTDDRAAPTASGGEQEPVACQNCGGAEMVWCDHMQRHIDCYCARDVACDDAGQSRVIDVGNESSAPPQPRGWLTERDRKTLIDAAVFLSGKGERGMSEAIEWILARSTPPEVVKPGTQVRYHSMSVEDQRDAQWIAAITAAGVAVKEVR